MATSDPRLRLKELAAGRGDSLAALSAMLGRIKRNVREQAGLA